MPKLLPLEEQFHLIRILNTYNLCKTRTRCIEKFRLILHVHELSRLVQYFAIVPCKLLFLVLHLVNFIFRSTDIWKYEGPVKLIKRVKIAHSTLQCASDQFHVIILSFPI